MIVWDNLCIHKTPYVTNIIENRATPNRFSSVDHPPYVPKIAPIEFIFYKLAAELNQRCICEWMMIDLQCNIIDVIYNIRRDENLHSKFVHCGYPY